MADKSSDSSAVYTAQIVIMEETYVRDSLDDIAGQFGLSRSELARRAMRAGLPGVADGLRAERAAIRETAGTGS